MTGFVGVLTDYQLMDEGEHIGKYAARIDDKPYVVMSHVVAFLTRLQKGAQVDVVLNKDGWISKISPAKRQTAPAPAGDLKTKMQKNGFGEPTPAAKPTEVSPARAPNELFTDEEIAAMKAKAAPKQDEKKDCTSSKTPAEPKKDNVAEAVAFTKKNAPNYYPTKQTQPVVVAPADPYTDEMAEFKALLLSVKREGIPEFLAHLENETDFFIAPSSTHYHDSCVGGLLHHSLTVYHNLVALSRLYAVDIPDDGSSLIIISLLHDLCKINLYKQERKSLPRRDDKGDIILDDWGRKIWDEQVVYTVDDQYPLGHGEKSVIMLQRYIRLTDTEIFAIRWHMMAYDDCRNSYAGNLAITNASDKYRIIPLFHMADLAASFLEMRPAVPEQGGA